MKKIIYLFVLLIALFTLGGCSKDEINTTQHKVTFNFHNNTTQVLNITHNYLLSDFPEDNKEGHTFLGWSFEGSNKPIDNYLVIFQDTNLVPIFTKNKYEVSFTSSWGNFSEEFLYGDKLVISKDSIHKDFENIRLYDYNEDKFLDKDTVIKTATSIWLLADYKGEEPKSVVSIKISDKTTIKTIIKNGTKLFLPEKFNVDHKELISIENIDTGLTFNKDIDTIRSNTSLKFNFDKTTYQIVFDSFRNGGGYINTHKVKHGESLGKNYPLFKKPNVNFRGWIDQQGNFIFPNTPIYGSLFLSPVYTELPTDLVMLKYITSDEGITITGLNNKELKSLVIPDTIEGKKVTSILDYAFMNEENLAEVTMPNSITTIGEGIFYNSSVTKVVFNNELEILPARTFENCSKLTSIIFPQQLQEIGNSCFLNCKGLIKINLPHNVKSIRRYGFAHCTSLTTLDLPLGLKQISDYSFYNCASLININFNPQLETIGEFAFAKCSKITELLLPVNLARVASYAFYNCESIYKLTVFSNTLFVNHSLDSTKNLKEIKLYIVSPNKSEQYWNYDYINKINHKVIKIK